MKIRLFFINESCRVESALQDHMFQFSKQLLKPSQNEDPWYPGAHDSQQPNSNGKMSSSLNGHYSGHQNGQRMIKAGLDHQQKANRVDFVESSPIS